MKERKVKPNMRVIALAACAILTACGGETPARGSEAEVQGEEVQSASDTANTGAADARLFVEEIFARYSDDGMGLDFQNPESVFEPELASVFRTEVERAQARETVPDLGDPFCACQDYTGMEWSVGEVQIDGSMARVPVETNLFGTDVTRIVTLSQTDEGWRVYDVGVEGYEVSFRADVLSR